MGGLVLAQHGDAVKEWGALGSLDLNLSAISYEPQINIKAVKGSRARRVARW